MRFGERLPRYRIHSDTKADRFFKRTGKDEECRSKPFEGDENGGGEREGESERDIA